MPESRVTAAQRRAVSARARDCCEYCRSQAAYALQAFSIEHIRPLNKGGATTLDNLALSCQGCNGHKHTKTENRDPVTGQIVLLFHPRRQVWSEHFTWNDDSSLMIGLTPTGRVTIEALKLNRSSVVNLRKALFRLGLHPPGEE